jgi:hypothetical protein
MGKFILLALAAIAALCSCGTPKFTAEITNKIPTISIGNRYLFYNSWGLEPGIVRCDTIQVVGKDKYCVQFCREKEDPKVYTMHKSSFKKRMRPIESKK